MASIISAGTTSGTALNMTGDTSGSLQLATNSGTTAVTIDTSQNVGIGTSTMVGTFNITRSAAGQLCQFTNTNASWAADVVTTYAPGGTTTSQFGISARSDATVWLTSGYGAMSFYTGTAGTASERMRIDSSGYLLVGVTSASTYAGGGSAFVTSTSGVNPLSLVSSAATPYGAFIYYTTSPNGTSQEFIICKDSSANRFVARSNGGLANYSANNVNLSDQREKTNIELAGSYLDKICAIPVKTFNYIDQNLKEDPGLTLGVIAQDVQAVAPELVSESNWGTEAEPKERLSIYQTDLQYALMKCIQEQQTIINDLKARITALEGAK